MPRGRRCLAHRHDELVPIVSHSVRPLPRGGLGSHTIHLCANAATDVHTLLDLIEDRAVAATYARVDEVIRDLPRETWASFGGAERVIAYKGWKTYGLGFLMGRYAIHYRHWRTDGSPKRADVPAFSDVMHAARWSRRWRREMERL